jgi:hypothetical protein
MKNNLLLMVLICCSAQAFGQSPAKTRDSAKNNLGPVSPFRMHYDDLFKRNADNTVSPVRPLQVNGEIVNTAVKITPGVKYGGIDLAAYAGHDMLVDTMRGLVIVRQFLK